MVMKKVLISLALAIAIVALWVRLDLDGGGGERSLPGEGRAIPFATSGAPANAELEASPSPGFAADRVAVGTSTGGEDGAPGTQQVAPASIEPRLRGRVLADESGAPLAGAKVWLGSSIPPFAAGGSIDVDELPAEPDQVAGPDGRFELPVPGALGGSVIVSAPGRTAVSAAFGAPGDSAGPELEVRVPRSAHLSGVVIDTRGVEAVLHVRLETGTSWLKLSPSLSLVPGHLRWSGRVESDGHFSIEDLPPGIALRATVFSNGEVTLREPSLLTLAAGEEREVEWRLTDGGGTTLFGRVVDENGYPLAGVTIWLLPSTEARWRWMMDRWTPTEQRVSDALGSFAFTDLIPGEWTVGAAPDEETVALCTRVTIITGEIELEVEVSRHEGQFIVGRVLTPRGDGAADVRVSALGLGDGASQDAGTDEVGSFRLGPLLPGEYRLQASHHGRGLLAPSEKVVVHAGSTGLVLRLELGGRLAGEVVEASSGERVSTAGVSIHSEGGGDYRTVMDRAGGVFDFGGLEPGSYHLIGTTTDGRTGSLRQVVVDAGTELRELRIPVQRGGYVRLRYEGAPENAAFSIEQEGVKYVLDVLHAGMERRVAVPPGELTVRLWGSVPVGPPSSSERRTFDHERKIEVDVGGEREVVFELDD